MSVTLTAIFIDNLIKYIKKGANDELASAKSVFPVTISK